MSYPSTTMTPTEVETFLGEKRHAVIATNRPGGPPQVSPVWYVYRNGKLYSAVSSTSAKCRNLRRDPRISVCVDGCYPDARYVVIYGTVQIIGDSSAWRDEIVRAISFRYHETRDEAERSLMENQDPDQVLLEITPEKIFSQNYN